ncbi:hypothetical protein D9M72_631050 [compost metagenome]
MSTEDWLSALVVQPCGRSPTDDTTSVAPTASAPVWNSRVPVAVEAAFSIAVLVTVPNSGLSSSILTEMVPLLVVWPSLTCTPMPSWSTSSTEFVGWSTWPDRVTV